MQISACKESLSELSLLHFLHQLFQRRSEVQTSVFLLSLGTILIKSTLVHVAPLPGTGQQHRRGLGAGRALGPLWKVLPVVDVLPRAVTQVRGLQGALGNTAVVLLFLPLFITFSMPITGSANFLGEPAWLGTKGKERN